MRNDGASIRAAQVVGHHHRVDEAHRQQLLLQVKAREEEERIIRELGRSLQRVLEADRWDQLAETERAKLVEQALSASTAAMAIKHSTGIEWTDDESDEGAGYEESTGVIHVPRHHLKTKDAEWFAAAIGHEVRHAWQWDVIEGRTTPPGGPAQSEFFKQAYDAYDAEDRFKYANNELEQDANDRAAYIIEGFREADLRLS
jgi:hypothetical protein